MLDEYLNKKEVISFISELENNKMLYSIKIHQESNYGKYIGNELALYIFYDILLKYKILIDDLALFGDFFEQVQKLYKKLNTCDDLVLGINKVICNFVANKLEVRDFKTREGRNTLITYIYNKYIVDGYYYHGFSTVYEDSILRNGFMPDDYHNFYDMIDKISQIFSKYGVSHVLNKEISSGKVYFTDDFVMSCYYSMVSPSYFYNFLFNHEIYGKKIRKDGYLINDYASCIKPLKRFMSNNLFNEKDKNEIVNLVSKIWDYIHKVDKKISILIVKRKLIDDNIKSNVLDFIDKDYDLYETIDRIFSSKYSNVVLDKMINSNDLEIISLDNFYKCVSVNKDPISKNVYISNIKGDKLNAYGRASIIIVLGSMMITFGVIITIISILRGY